MVLPITALNIKKKERKKRLTVANNTSHLMRKEIIKTFFLKKASGAKVIDHKLLKKTSSHLCRREKLYSLGQVAHT